MRRSRWTPRPQPTRWGRRTRPGGLPGWKVLRYAVPVVVAAAGLVPALADAGEESELPAVTAEELLARVAAAEVRQLSGTVRITTDLGIPALPDTALGSARSGAGDADPRAKLLELASGSHVLRVAVDGPERQRVSVIEEAAEYSLVRNGRDVWAYDSAAGAVHHTVLPEGTGRGRRPEPPGPQDATPQEAAERALAALDPTTSVTVDGTTRVAGRDAYRLLVEPRRHDSTVGSVRIAVDADTGVPLRFALVPLDGGGAAIDVRFTEVDFAKPAADAFAFTPPAGARVTERRLEGSAGAPSGRGSGTTLAERLSGLRSLGEGWGAVARLRLPAPPGSGPTVLSDVEASRVRRLLDGFTDQVEGDFGTGRVLGSRLVNALVTDDGAVYVGAVTRGRLVRAANEAAG